MNGEREISQQSAGGTVGAIRVTVRGTVQGIGYRPALARLATRLGLAGWVANSGRGLELHVEGPPDRLAAFEQRCRSTCPPEGHVDAIQSAPAVVQLESGFQIRDRSDVAEVDTPVPTDRVTCPICRDEIADPQNRRHGYWLTTCSSCGPRYTILTGMPYERYATTLHGFPLCDPCRAEYENPEDRRFHAQTIGCPNCGPQVVDLPRGLAALRAGEVVALKGVGGYQLLARADHTAAIDRLRQVKHRPWKPLAIMVADVAQARRFASVDGTAERHLISAAGPIVILPRAPDMTAKLVACSERIGPGLNSLGILFPTSALHQRVVEEVGPVIVSSANLEGDPIAFRAEIADPPWPDAAVPTIVHNRPIQRPLDDSVVRAMGPHLAVIRLARGLAPLPLPLAAPPQGEHVLAVGGQQKVAIALVNGRQAILGPHIGDLASLAARRRFVEHVHDLLDLYGCHPTVVAHDAHPDYFTTRWAQDFAAQRGAAVVSVQHHLAHAASSVLQPGWWNTPVLAVTWDGSGWGSDGMIWGGEAWSYSLGAATRCCRLRPLRLPGGEAAIHEPWRIVAGLVAEIRANDPGFTALGFPTGALDPVFRQPLLCPVTTSIGRLFDAAAVLILGPDRLPGRRVGYEGHFAALLESACDPQAEGQYPLPLVPHRGIAHLEWEWDWEPLIRQIVQDQQAGLPRGTMAMRFHRGLAMALVALVQRQPATRVTLSGGVFQNQMLVQLIAQALVTTRYEMAWPGLIPVNDGGLAAGQTVVALATFRRG
jgi:hydrogenase maturation protein HypF